MTQYVETTNEDKMIELQAKVNIHLDGKNNKSIVDTHKHLTEDRWFFDYDRFVKYVGKKYTAERMQQIGEFVSDNEDVNFAEYASKVEAGFVAAEGVL